MYSAFESPRGEVRVIRASHSDTKNDVMKALYEENVIKKKKNSQNFCDPIWKF